MTVSDSIFQAKQVRIWEEGVDKGLVAVYE